MSRARAKKYANAVLNVNSLTAEEVLGYLGSLNKLSKEAKFKDVVLSPLVKADDKEEILLSGVENVALKNFVKLLIEKNALDLISDIYEEVRLSIAKKDATYSGILYAKGEVDNSILEDIAKKISEQFNAKVEFEFRQSSEDGFRIEVADLGIEASFSSQRLKKQLIEHILRGI